MRLVIGLLVAIAIGFLVKTTIERGAIGKQRTDAVARVKQCLELQTTSGRTDTAMMAASECWSGQQIPEMNEARAESRHIGNFWRAVEVTPDASNWTVGAADPKVKGERVVVNLEVDGKALRVLVQPGRRIELVP